MIHSDPLDFESLARAAEGHSPNRQWVERALERYPHLPSEELQELKRWFEDEASALDVGLVASNDRILNEYKAFRAEHLDPFTLRDLVRAVLFVTFFLGGVVGLLAAGAM